MQLPQSMYVQNQLFRRPPSATSRRWSRKWRAIRPALIWPDGIGNRNGYTNENFSRELLELFTMGVVNYSQDDVVAASRAFAWLTTIDGLKGIYVLRHDNGMEDPPWAAPVVGPATTS
ncbi:MAG: DUF1800 family protein [Candidatus Eisenbacteria bacterium]